ncbi:MAG: hypothetical protein J0I20_26055 [Chloroflexi bacterium]|nr:hypothetical protein [Chloroflexota bacterium]OJW06481.1 MAG: hypothetical protein BGO39_00245 [Chloroflexi bacterium 54-19]
MALTKTTHKDTATPTPKSESAPAASFSSPYQTNAALIQRLRHDRHSVTPAEVLQLQRTLGNRAVTGLLKNTGTGDKADRAGPASPTSSQAKKEPLWGGKAPAVIQRRIGFEIETGIPVIRKEHLVNNFEPMSNNALESKVPGGKLMVDHLPGHPATAEENFNEWNIIEFVTDPLNDKMKNAAFRATIQPWLQNLVDIRNHAQAGFGHFELAPHVGPPLSNRTFLGIRPGGPGSGGYNHWNRVAPQATMGVKLSNVGAIFNEAKAGGFEGHVRHDRVSEGAHEAEPAATAILNQITTQFPPGVGKSTGKDNLKGLLTLICNYLLTGEALRGKGGYLKNQSLFMYKSKLSSVRNDIISQAYPEKILGRYGPRRITVRNLIMAQTNRAAGEDVMDGAEYPEGTPVDVQDWLDEVLDGTDDKMFMAMKNPWSNELGPENVSKKKGAIMEMRDISAYDTGGLNLSLNNIGEVVDYLTRVYALNRRWSKE